MFGGVSLPLITGRSLILSQLCASKIFIFNYSDRLLGARMLRIALFGTGRHAYAILRCAAAELIAVLDPSDIAQTAMLSDVENCESR